MKLKKILASVAAFAMAATAFSGVVMANSYGTPELKMTVEYPYDFYEDPEDCDYLVVKLSYEGFQDFAAYKKQAGVGLTSIGVTLDYDSEKLSYEDAEADTAKFPGAVLGTKAPSVQWAAATAGMVPETSYDDFATFVFAPETGVDLTAESLTFTVTAIEFGVTKAVKGQEPTVEKYGNSAGATEDMKADPVTYGSSAPVVEYVNVTTDGNVEGVADGQVEKGSKIAVSAKVVEGNTATLYANGVEIVDGAEYEFTEDVSFTVEYTPIPPAVEYNYSIVNSGYRASEKAGKEDVFYKLNISAIAEGAKALLATVATKNFEVPMAAPVVEGAVDVDFTFMFLGVPADVFGTTQDSVNGQFTAFGTDNQEYEAK